jgi:hypothetical protein
MRCDALVFGTRMPRTTAEGGYAPRKFNCIISVRVEPVAYYKGLVAVCLSRHPGLTTFGANK